MILVLSVITWKFETRLSMGTSWVNPTQIPLNPSATAPANEIRILCGYTKENYIDRRGKVWESDHYFHGGAASIRSLQTITRTLDPTVFQQSRMGEFPYDIPLKEGVYELRLYFAETEFAPAAFVGGGEGSRIFEVNLNGKPLLVHLDVYRDAIGIMSPTNAFSRMWRRIPRLPSPGVSLFLPGKALPKRLGDRPRHPGKLRPIRLVARENSFTDQAGQMWSPDRYFLRGRLATHKVPVENTSDPDLYTAERYGNFEYAIPVAPGKYGFTLRFAETFFGNPNAGDGGVGSRSLQCLLQWTNASSQLRYL